MFFFVCPDYFNCLINTSQAFGLFIFFYISLHMMVVSERIQLLSSWTHVLTADLSGFGFCTLCTRIIFLCVGFFKDIFVPLGQGAVRKSSEGKNDDVKSSGWPSSWRM